MTIRFDSLPIATSRIEITSPFGKRSINDAEEPHNAVDIRGAEGTPILAVSDGVVHRIVNQPSGCGTGIVLLHKDVGITTGRTEYTTTYCHMQAGSITDFAKLTVGAPVKAGQIIGKVGMTGRTYGPHLHFILKRVNGLADSPGTAANVPDTPIDPTPYLLMVDRRAAMADAMQKPSVRLGLEYTVGGMSPYIASFDSFHPKIQYELTRRRLAAETANSYTPFIKLTSLLKVDKENLDGVSEAWCPTLGIHGQAEESFDNIYFPQGNNSIIGYATAKINGRPRRIPVLVENSSADQQNIPVPGITSVTTERTITGPMGVRGGLFRANITILAYSVGQINALLKYFLRPSTNVLLEFGRVSSSQSETQINAFNWNRSKEAISVQMADLFTKQEEQEKFINDTVYANYGNYEAFIGYVANFNFKYTKNNTFEITLTVHSTQQFEIPTIHTGAKATCTAVGDSCKSFDIKEYFDESYSWKANSFKRLLESVESGLLKQLWESHVIPLRQPDSNPDQAKPGTHSSDTNTRGGYLISWEFFVNVLLNDEEQGMASVLPLSSFGLEGIGFIKSAFIKPVDSIIAPDNAKLIANEVGYHPNLRSVHPWTMVIYNPTANGESDADATTQDVNNVLTNQNVVLEDSRISQKIKTSVVGAFTNINGDDNTVAGTSLLSKGVWLNTDMIIQAFTASDSVSAALNAILSKMNSATEGYWNLQLLSNDNTNPGTHVIDMGLSKNKGNAQTRTLPTPSPESSLTSKEQIIPSEYGEGSKPKYVYMFNRKSKSLSNDDLGTELLDINVEFGLPTMIAVQAIAGVGGVAQKSAWQAIDIEGLNKLKLLPNFYAKCTSSNGQQTVCPDDPVLRLETQLKFEREDVAAAEDRLNVSLVSTNPVSDFSIINNSTRLAKAKIKQENTENELAGIRLNNPNLLPIIREYNHLGNALKFIEFNPSQMVAKLNADSGNNSGNRPVAHAFNSSNLTKTLVDLTLPGIGGIQLFQTFLVDRIPSILDQGYYIVTKVAHEFTIDRGWITKIQGRFRYAPRDN